MIITHNTGKAELCFVKVPEGSTGFCIEAGHLFTGPSSNNDWNLHCRIELPQGNWQIVGNPFELSQEVIKDLVPEMRDSGFPFEVQEITDTWKELLDKWGIYQTNPIPKPDINHEKYFPISDDDKDTMFVRDWDKWEDAEERTGNWILLRNI